MQEKEIPGRNRSGCGGTLGMADNISGPSASHKGQIENLTRQNQSKYVWLDSAQFLSPQVRYNENEKGKNEATEKLANV
ncbi:hypothetical protein M413DRAFT_438710 [Hebeloma cylindrosporum]|uniref:Uncharacterized protein n=1 Tax=Hebeloma cylindrosporum TaxID=76867 RepID=A0A0C3CZD8_HEBCY|nr:hypothetical protein M413DRAFT_438710 [Hebeloma cylindrosporum h7]